jgi:ankyrin repeat protein
MSTWCDAGRTPCRATTGKPRDHPRGSAQGRARGYSSSMPSEDVREAVDEGDVDALRHVLLRDPSLVTSLVDAPDIEPTSPLTYVGMARFYGYASHDRTGALTQALLDAGADKDRLSEFQGACALRAAAVNDRLDVIDEVLAAGTPIDSEVDGHPAVFWANRQGRSRAVAHLMARGARA